MSIILTKFLCLAAMTTSGGASDKNFVNITIFPISVYHCIALFLSWLYFSNMFDMKSCREQEITTNDFMWMKLLIPALPFMALQLKWSQGMDDRISNLQPIVYIDAINSSLLGQNDCHFPDNIFNCIFMDETFCISIQISLKFILRDQLTKTLLSMTTCWCLKLAL